MECRVRFAFKLRLIRDWRSEDLNYVSSEETSPKSRSKSQITCHHILLVLHLVRALSYTIMPLFKVRVTHLQILDGQYKLEGLFANDSLCYS